MDKRRCLFCGDPLDGQKRNFEHIIPRWLAKEADLERRKMPLETRDRRIEVGMGRIGMKVCVRCNNDGSNLEGDAKLAYLALARGDDLDDGAVRTLLDWLDKIRIGMWLWLLENSKESVPIDPKFRINQRMAGKDRILLAKRYPQGLKGLGFWGVEEYFLCVPSSIGLFINNVALVSLSADFLLARHLCDLRPEVAHGPESQDRFDVVPARESDPRLTIIGGPAIFGQCILPEDMFAELGLAKAAGSKLNEGLSEGPILRLDEALREAPTRPANVPLFDGNMTANLMMMELNVIEAASLLCCDYERADTQLISGERLENVTANMFETRLGIDASSDELRQRFRRITGLSLPAGVACR